MVRTLLLSGGALVAFANSFAVSDDRASLLEELDAWKKSEPGMYAAANGFAPRATESADASSLDKELQLFADAKATVAKLNTKYPHATFSVATPFTLMTNEAFAKWVAGTRTPKNVTAEAAPTSVSTATDTVDWTASGCVGPVKNQGSCGDCYAFAATGAAESAYCLQYDRKLVLFSDQQTTSCGPGYGCSGGYPDHSLKWMGSNGICTMDSYPFANAGLATALPCKQECAPIQMPWRDVAMPKGEALIEKALAQMPIVLELSASSQAFQYYKGGILTADACTGTINHAVLGVGYGTAELPYFRLKNSWSTGWGEGGYARIQRGVGGGSACGVAYYTMHPVYSWFNIVTINNLVVSEYYSSLYANPKSGSKNEQWTYDGPTRQIIVGSNKQCLDAYPNGAGGYNVHTYACDANNNNQKWTVDPSNHRIMHETHANLCLAWIARSNEKVVVINVAGLAMTTYDNEAVSFSGASTESMEWWVNNADHTIRTVHNKCIDAFEPKNGGTVHLYDCDGSNANQKWIFDPATKQFRHMTHQGFCLDMGSANGVRAHLWTCDAANTFQQFYYAS
ncbi:cysteine protease family C01A [Achlya hypogyna]|uniref:Cysteine protease family C01A n=1 Tax=Achlya hypogyna TaxID=1202772 RepID=A0A1V9YJZ1_ACHHY|nr:cysteine protease family C01A [Achlya hypogyna]